MYSAARLPRQAHEISLAEAEEPVRRTGLRKLSEFAADEIRRIPRNQPPDERLVNDEFVGVETVGGEHRQGQRTWRGANCIRGCA